MKILFTLFLTLWSMTTFADSPSLQGQWLAENQSTQIEISQSESGLWQGIVTKSPSQPELTGQQILSEMVEVVDGFKGKVYAIKKAKHYEADISLADGTLQIEVKAGFFTKTMIWTRIE